MNTFKRKSLHAAVLAGLGAVGMAGTANAVHVNPDGTGSVLIFPYYTARADGGDANSTAYYTNYISLVNTTNSTKAVKVRFLEGKNSREVLDFNLFLSPQDVWTGAVFRTTDGAGLVSADNSCVVPTALFAEKDPTKLTSGSLNHFKNFAYAALNDGGGTTLDRTREGYLEIIEMGDVTNATATANAKHNSAGVPANCAYFQANDPEASMTPQLTAPTGGLYGGMSIINVKAGTDFSYDAVALDQWSNAVRYTRAGALGPDIGQASPATSNVFTSGGVVQSTWVDARDAVSATMMHSSVMNEWMLDSGTASGTDWVVTFPTKKLYVNVGTGAAALPFNANFNNGKSCDVFSLAYFNREEGTSTVIPTVLPSPEPTTPVTVNTFCYEANVLTFANSNMLGSENKYNFDPTGIGRNGQAQITFNDVKQVITPIASNGGAPLKHFGLPVVGFAIQDFSNGNVGGVASNYGGLFAHKYRRTLLP